MRRTAILVLATAAAFAVAIAVLVTAPRSSVSAQTPDDNTPEPDVVIEAYTEVGGGADDGDDSNDIAAFGAPSYGTDARDKRGGDTVIIQVTDLGPNDGDADPPETGSVATLFRFNVDSSSTANGTFKSGGKTSLTCADGRTCDLDSDTDDIIVQFDIADDAANDTDLVINVVNIDDNKTVRVVFSVNAALSVTGPAPNPAPDAPGLNPAPDAPGPNPAPDAPDPNPAQTPTDNSPAPDVIVEAYTEVGGGADDGDDSNDIAAFSTPSASPSKRGGESVIIQVTDLGPGDGDADPPEAGSVATLFRFNVDSSSTATGTFKSGGGTTLNCADNRASCDLDSDNDDIIIQFDIADGARANTSVVINVVNIDDNKTVRVVISVTGPAPDAPTPNPAQTPTDNSPAPDVVIEAYTEVGGGADDGNDGNDVAAFGRPSYGADARAKRASDTVIIQVTDLGPGDGDAGTPDAGSLATLFRFNVDSSSTASGTFKSGGGTTLNCADNRASCDLDSDNDDIIVQFDIADDAADGSDLVINVVNVDDNKTVRVVFSVNAALSVTGPAPNPAPDAPGPGSVEVGGSVFVSTDAPDRVDAGSTTSIVVTVVDDEGGRAGAQTVEVTQVAGSGVTRNGGPAVTKDGQHTFTYRAANRTDTAEFDIQVRANKTDGTASASGKSLASLALSIAVGDEPAPALPEQPTAAGVSSNAPDRVEPGSRTEITVTVTDVDGEPAGMQSVTATQVSGDGRVINGGPAATTDGVYTFTFRAAGTTGTAEIDVEVRALNADGEATGSGKVLASTILFIAIGDEAATPPPASNGLPASFYGGGLDAGDVVTASIDGAACGEAEVGDGGGWSILVEEGGCGGKAVDGATIAFAIDGRAARPTATWRAGGLPDDREGGIALTAAGMTIGLRGARAVYVQDAGGGFDIHVVGAPEFVNARFGQRWIVAATPLTLTLDTEGARAFYVQSADGAFDSHVVGAPDFVNAAFARRWIADAIE